MISFKILYEIFKNFLYVIKFNIIFSFNKNPDMSNVLDIDFNERFQKHLDFISLFKNNFNHLDKNNFLELGPGGSLSNFYTSKIMGFKNYYAYDGIKHDVFGNYANSLYNVLKNKNNIELTPSYSNYFHTDLSSINLSKIDFFYSWGVLEHVDDLDKMFEFFHKNSSKNSIHLHVVDTHPHGWSKYKNPYLIFNISNFLWKLMYSRRYFINRKRESHYKKILSKHNFKEILFDVNEVNNFLKKEYPDETLINDLDDIPNKFDKNKFLREFKYLDTNDILKRRFVLCFKKIN